MTPGRDLTRLPQVLFEIGKAIGSDENVGTLLTVISELVTELVAADAVSIMFLDADRRKLLGKAAYGLARRDISKISFRIGEGVAGWVAAEGKSARIDDVSVDSRFVQLADSQTRIASLLCVPLLNRDRPIGVMTATSSRSGAFSTQDQDVLEFVAKTIAIDVENVRLRKLAITDPLTRAYNREYLQQQLPQALDTAHKREQTLSIAMIDIDHFKLVNDRFGHAVGDRVLSEVAKRLRSAIRDDDTLVRYGGEEFLALLPKADVATARDIAERMRSKLQRRPVRVGEHDIEVRISVGVAEHHPGEETSTDLMRRADLALYAAKELGRNRVEVAA
jgi:diguanylate cyclase (GGDEF)-like protein